MKSRSVTEPPLEKKTSLSNSFCSTFLQTAKDLTTEKTPPVESKFEYTLESTAITPNSAGLTPSLAGSSIPTQKEGNFSLKWSCKGFGVPFRTFSFITSFLRITEAANSSRNSGIFLPQRSQRYF